MTLSQDREIWNEWADWVLSKDLTMVFFVPRTINDKEIDPEQVVGEQMINSKPISTVIGKSIEYEFLPLEYKEIYEEAINRARKEHEKKGNKLLIEDKDKALLKVLSKNENNEVEKKEVFLRIWIPQDWRLEKRFYGYTV